MHNENLTVWQWHSNAVHRRNPSLKCPVIQALWTFKQDIIL